MNATSRTPSLPPVSPSPASSFGGCLAVRAAIMPTSLHAQRSDSGSSVRREGFASPISAHRKLGTRTRRSNGASNPAATVESTVQDTGMPQKT